MKSFGFNRVVTVLLFSFLLFGCGTGDSGSVVTIEMSPEAREYADTVLVNDVTKDMLREENFDLLLGMLELREGQSFGDCDVKNSLDCFDFGGSEVYTLSCDGYDCIVLYIHGGAWCFEISSEHVSFCDDLATRLNARVYIPLYPLAPEASSEQTYECIEGLYKEVLGEGLPVYVMGDSAGGNIALGLMYTIKQENLKKPDKLVLLAPCCDMSFSNEDIAEINKRDLLLDQYGSSRCALLWAGDNIGDPKYSAVYADVSGYPDTIIFQGTDDIVCPDNLILFEHMRESGVDVTFVRGEGLWHVFPIYPIPEREVALGLIGEFCGE